MLLAAVLGPRDLGDAIGLDGAGTGGSLALCMVRACLVGGGAKIEVYKVWLEVVGLELELGSPVIGVALG
jgi:hypothetical protein